MSLLLDSYLSQRRFIYSLFLDNVFLINCFSALSGLIFHSPLIFLYLQGALAGSATAVTRILGAQAVASFIVQMPAGVLADLYGRKCALFLCSVLRTLSLLLMIFIDGAGDSLRAQRFQLFLVAAALEGIAQSLYSGADVALLYDSLLVTGRVVEFKSRLAVKSLLWPSAAALSAFVGGALGNSEEIRIPLILTAGASILSILVVACMKEPDVRSPCPAVHRDSKYSLKLPRVKRKENSAEDETESEREESEEENSPDSRSSSPASLSHSSSSPSLSNNLDSPSSEPLSPDTQKILATLPESPVASQTITKHTNRAVLGFFNVVSHCRCTFDSLRSNPQIQALLLSSLLLYAFSESTHRLRSVFYHSQGIPSNFHGLLGGLSFALSSVGSYHSPRLAQKFGAKQLLQITAALTPALQLISSFTNSFICSFALLGVSFLFGIRGPLLSSLINERVSPKCRATIFSLQSLANKLSLAICLPGLAGPITDNFGIHWTVRTFAFLALIPLFWISVAITGGEEEETKNQQDQANIENKKVKTS